MNHSDPPFDPIDPDSSGPKRGIPLIWILLPVFLVFLTMMGSTLWHLVHNDYMGFAMHQHSGPLSPGK
ncbi:MAG: hypothetical protein ACYCYP_01330 [Leptospirales bacterium]